MKANCGNRTTVIVLASLLAVLPVTWATAEDGALTGKRHRILVSTDIGGTDPDDFQSLVHLLVYADSFDLEGLISSPYGPGRKSDILTVIGHYERDYASLSKHSKNYPTADVLRSLTKQGETEAADDSGVGLPTEGSRWLIQCAQRDDLRPLHVLVWGGLEDLAQALHDAPGILPKLRVYWIGGPNKKWSANAYNYIEQHHPKLWIIESNATYRGWFVGGNQDDEWGNQEFVTRHIAGHGSLGDYFNKQLKGTIKMGDTPSLARLLKGQSDDPEQPSWGGQYVRIWDNRKTIFHGPTTEADTTEVFGITEFVFPKPDGFSAQNSAAMIFNGGLPKSPVAIEGDQLRFRFSPRDAKLWSYAIESDFAALHGVTGKFHATPPPADRTDKTSTVHPTWWIDDPDPNSAEGVHPGAKSVNRWRQEFLSDFAKRMDRCNSNSVPIRKSDDAHATDGRRRATVVLGVEPDKRQRPRVIVTTDGEVDDRSSMIRFLLYACDFDVAGIVQVNSKFQKRGHSDKKWIEAQLDAYERVLPNLRKHHPAYPAVEQLRSVMRVGNETEADLWVAPPDMQTKNTAGAKLIIDTLLDDDPRPVHVPSWGGANTTASALWKLKTEYTKEQFDYAVSRIRIYCIWYQDGGGAWIQNNIPGAYIYEAYRWDNVWDYESYDHARKQGKLSANPPSIQEYMKDGWLNEHVKFGHGPLGAMTPQKYISEGDTPSFLNLTDNGLEADVDYTLGGWGGRAAYDDPKFPNHMSDKSITDDGDSYKMFWRWVPAAQNDFAARMDWCVKDFTHANHPPVVQLKESARRTCRPGETVTLSALANDPDGNTLKFRWWQYADADSATATVNIVNAESLDNANFTAPNEPGKQVQIILEATDNGTPRLTGYQRVIITIDR